MGFLGRRNSGSCTPLLSVLVPIARKHVPSSIQEDVVAAEQAHKEQARSVNQETNVALNVPEECHSM